MKYVLYTKEILLLHRSDKAIRRSALFHWVPNVNSCSLFIIFPAGDSLNQTGSSSFQRPWTKSGITHSIRKTQAQHRNLKKKKKNARPMIIIYFYPQMNLIRLIRLKKTCREHRFNRGFWIDNRQSFMSGEGLQCRSEAATCNQKRSKSLRRNCRDFPIPDGIVLTLVVAHGSQALLQMLTAKTAEITCAAH